MSSPASEKKTVFGLPYNVGIGFLCVLGAVVLYAFYSNVLAGPPGVSAPPDAGKSTVASAAAAAPTIPMPGADAPQRRPASTQRRNNEEFSPPFHRKGPENQIEPKNVDPTLRLDLLRRVQAVELAGGSRNLFQFGPPPPKPAELLAKDEPRVRPIGPVRPPEKVAPSSPPPAPVLPIQLKFYGFSTVRHNGAKTAYFMDTDDTILIAAEGELLKRRYRVIKILATSVLMEDTESKRTENIPITPEAQS